MNYEQRLKAAAKVILESDSESSNKELFNCDEIGVRANLKPHQVEGISWLIRRYTLGVNVILGDEMGLGKTLQAITFLSYLKVAQKSPGPFLVLCPLSVTDGWVSEIEKFTSKLRVLRYVGDKEHRRSLRQILHQHVNSSSRSTVPGFPFDVLLTTYDIALLDQDFLSQFPWQYTVIDEAQRLKNPSSVLYGVLTERFIMPRRLLMTGTPIQNNLTELWALMHFCMPLVFGKLDQFLPTFKEAGDPSQSHTGTKAKEQLQTLKLILQAFMLRRTKSKLIESGTLSLPPLTEITVMVPLVALQKKVYLSIMRKELPKLLAFASGNSNIQSLHNMVIQLRKASSHPYHFPGIEPEPYKEGEHLVQASGKLIILDQLLQRLYDAGHRVLLFAQMTHTLDILQDYMELRKYSYERLDGSVRAEERFAAIRSFSQLANKDKSGPKLDEPGPFVFMISTRAGGVGLNLIAADTVIFYEQDWNPQVDRQALQRAHRIGQMNHVLCISLVVENSIEEVILRRARRKLQLSHNVVGDDVVNTEENGASGAEPSDLRSVIYSLHKFDTEETSGDKEAEIIVMKLSVVADKVIAKRHVENEYEDTGSIEISPMDLDGKKDDKIAADENFDPGLDEASYISWVEKFKEAAQRGERDSLGSELQSRRSSLEEKQQRTEVARKKAEEKKLSKWQAHGYQSLSISDPLPPGDSDVISDHGGVHFISGDCTRPSSTLSGPCIIFSCVDNSGSWGRGGMFNAVAKLSSRVTEAYERASQLDDLHLGDLHLISVADDDDNAADANSGIHWVALAVVQSYSSKRKVPRSDISVPDLERCIAKVTSVAAQNSASIHMPRVGYQDGLDRAVWYSAERLLRKYGSLYGVDIFVYYYKRASS